MWQPLHFARRLAEDTGADVHVVDSAGHFCMEDRPDTVAELIASHVMAQAR